MMLTVERIDDGEISPYLAQDARTGDRFERRGPIGGHFVWTSAMDGLLLLVAGGSGIVSLMSMLRHRAAAASRVPARTAVFLPQRRRPPPPSPAWATTAA